MPSETDEKEAVLWCYWRARGVRAFFLPYIIQKKRVRAFFLAILSEGAKPAWSILIDCQTCAIDST
jgi:hypothetical protein